MTKPGYFILELDIHDAEKLVPYLENVRATLAPFPFQPLINGDPVEPLEGEKPKSKVVVLRFDSMEAARDWYGSAAYQAILGHRLDAADNRAYLVEGLEA